MDIYVMELLEKYPVEIRDLFDKLESLLLENVNAPVVNKVWTKLPSYYVGEKFVRLIPFKDHLNIQADAMLKNKDLLKGYKLTPKGMLHLRPDEEFPGEALIKVFKETLE